MSTYFVKAAEIQRSWHLIDAKDEILGKVAVGVVKYLTGKNKVQYSPNADIGDYVVIINAAKLSVTGKKKQDKMYYWHSQYPGGFKSTSLGKMLQKRPDRVIEHAVKGMLPHNKLGRHMMRRLHVYKDDSHPHQAQITESSSKTTT